MQSNLPKHYFIIAMVNKQMFSLGPLLCGLAPPSSSEWPSGYPTSSRQASRCFAELWNKKSKKSKNKPNTNTMARQTGVPLSITCNSPGRVVPAGYLNYQGIYWRQCAPSPAPASPGIHWLLLPSSQGHSETDKEVHEKRSWDGHLEVDQEVDSSSTGTLECRRVSAHVARYSFVTHRTPGMSSFQSLFSLSPEVKFCLLHVLQEGPVIFAGPATDGREVIAVEENK